MYPISACFKLLDDLILWYDQIFTNLISLSLRFKEIDLNIYKFIFYQMVLYGTQYHHLCYFSF